MLERIARLKEVDVLDVGVALNERDFVGLSSKMPGSRFLPIGSE